ncbi:MAG: hypothetical protein AAF268_08305 [Cyanobacteria bacterium P01_A01_bin.3]
MSISTPISHPKNAVRDTVTSPASLAGGISSTALPLPIEQWLSIFMFWFGQSSG